MSRPTSTRLTLAGLVTSALAFALMQTLLIPALPVLQRELGTSQEWITWTITVYLLTGSVVTPIFGRLGDQYGKVRMAVISLGVFLVGSLGALVSWDVASLVVARGVQGVGAAVFPLAYAIIRDEFPERDWSVAMGVVSATLGVGGGIGIVAAGVIVDNASWRWLFALSAVVGLLALVLVWRFIPESPVRSPSRVDVPGALLLSGGLVCLLVALTEGEPQGWGSPAIIGLFAASAVLLAAWGVAESRIAQPMVDLRMLARRTVLFTNLTALMSGFALYATWVLLPTFFQLPANLPAELRPLADYGFGTSVTVAGLWMLPTSCAIIVAGPVGGLLGRRFGARLPLAAGMLLLAAGCAGIALWHGSPTPVAVSFLVAGLGIGFSFAAMPRLIVGAVAPTETAVATGMNNVIRTVGGVVGAQIAAVLVAAHHVNGGPVPAERGFTIAFWVSVAGAVVGAGTAFLISGRRARPVAVAVSADA
ncbi:MAG: MFS transporter [Thermoleophilia bacterium]|nr:MFS transporter [Thermoleophilia bacterium]